MLFQGNGIQNILSVLQKEFILFSMSGLCKKWNPTIDSVLDSNNFFCLENTVEEWAYLLDDLLQYLGK